MTTKYKAGQKVNGSRGAGSRVVVKVSPTKIWWKNSKSNGVCNLRSFGLWKAGYNLAKNR